jgi:hypothetical protein
MSETWRGEDLDFKHLTVSDLIELLEDYDRDLPITETIYGEGPCIGVVTSGGTDDKDKCLVIKYAHGVVAVPTEEWDLP